MALYVTKPCIIEAVLWNGNNTLEIAAFTNGEAYFGENGLVIHTLEGDMHANIGDYIIKGLRGEFYPCKPDVFDKKYAMLK